MYLVAGLGITGESVLRYFQAQGEPCMAFDTRETVNLSALQASFPEVAFAQGASVPKAWLNRFDTLVLSPGIAQSEPWVVALKQLGKQVIGDIELFARAVGAPVIAITGSNGKSTVTTMTGMALQTAGYCVAVGGNIGQPVLDLLIDEQEYDVYVLELSSFQLETTYTLESVAATVLNISEDHMDRYEHLEDYILAKTKVFEHTDLAVLPEGFNPLGMTHHAKVIRFGCDEKTTLSDNEFGVLHLPQGLISECEITTGGGNFLGFGKNPLVAVSDMRLQGTHHQLNALAMMALCQPFHVNAEHFRHVLQSFTGLPHRTQWVGEFHGVAWINDSKGTNVGATLTAIESLGGQVDGKLILILGGVSKEADFSSLQPAIQKWCRHTLVFGRDKALISEDLPEVALTLVNTLEEAVNQANTLATSGDCVLFSPACASFDQFKHYIHRGEVFMQQVQMLQIESAASESVALPEEGTEKIC